MRIVTIIQARLSSSRLPGKVMMSLGDQPVIEWVYERAAQIPGVDEVLVATSTDVGDDPLADWCHRHGVPVFRGSQHDVLDRYLNCARQVGADAVVRVTADCPLLDPALSGRVLRRFLDARPCDYASNCEPPTFPDGLDTEVISFGALETSWRDSSDPFDREHVTAHVRRNQDRFAIQVLRSDPDLSHHRWTLDEIRDYTFLSAVVERLARQGLSGSMQEILQVLEDEPELLELNAGIVRNAGGPRVVSAG